MNADPINPFSCDVSLNVDRSGSMSKRTTLNFEWKPSPVCLPFELALFAFSEKCMGGDKGSSIILLVSVPQTRSSQTFDFNSKFDHTLV